MTDDTQIQESHRKVVNIFQRHLRGDQFHFEVEDGGEVVVSPDGFTYVTLWHERPKNGQGWLQDEEKLFGAALKKNYILKFLETHKEGVRMNHYHVPAHRLEEFLMGLSKRPGKLLEIKQFIPDTTA